MRKELFYRPDLLLERLAVEIVERKRLRRLRGTRASWLARGHLDSLELIEIAAQAGARVFFDVGAAIGTWSLLCRALVPESIVVALEPQPRQCAQFRMHTAGLRDVTLLEVAAGAADETRPLLVTNLPDASSLLPLTPEGERTWGLHAAAAVPVQTYALDGLIQRHQLPWPDLIKLDVQGFELEVLKGARLALQKARWVLAEVSFRPFYEKQVLFPELAQHLERAGFHASAFGHSVKAGVSLDQVDVLFQRSSSSA